MANSTGKPGSALHAVDPIWTTLREEAADIVAREPVLAGLIYASILAQEEN